MKNYNFTVADSFKETVVIPYTGIEVKGWTSIVAGVVGVASGTFVLGTPLAFVFKENGYIIALGISVFVLLVYVFYANEINQETGRNKIWEFYYLSIKKYRCIYDSLGEKHYIPARMEGVIYYNACRKNLRRK